MKFSNTRILLATAALACAGAASAADTATLLVSATVLGVCKFSGTPTAMAITSPSVTYLDPTLTSNGTGTSTVSYKCTKTSSPTLSVGGTATSPYSASGSNGLSSGGGSPTYIPFSIAWTQPAANSGAGFSAAASTLTLTGTVLNTDYVNANAGTYSASVALSINP
jgi:hypothetical protein